MAKTPALVEYERWRQQREPDVTGAPLTPTRAVDVRERLNAVAVALSATFEALSEAQRSLGVASAAPERPTSPAPLRGMTQAERRGR